MLDVLTYLFYLLSKPDIPVYSPFAVCHTCTLTKWAAKLLHFFCLCKSKMHFFGIDLVVRPILLLENVHEISWE